MGFFIQKGVFVDWCLLPLIVTSSSSPDRSQMRPHLVSYLVNHTPGMNTVNVSSHHERIALDMNTHTVWARMSQATAFEITRHVKRQPNKHALSLAYFVIIWSWTQTWELQCNCNPIVINYSSLKYCNCNCVFNYNILPLAVSEILGGPIFKLGGAVPPCTPPSGNFFVPEASTLLYLMGFSISTF